VTGFTGPPNGTIVNGTLHATDGPAQTAQSDLTTAYNAAAALTPCTDETGKVLGQDIGTVATPLLPGVYCFSSSAQLTGSLHLSGAGTYVFQIGTTLTTAPGSSVVLDSNASSCDVFWQVGSSATIDTTTQFVGTVMANASISVNNGAVIDGRLLARTGLVSLINDTITAPTCAATTTTSSTTIPGATTTVPGATTTVPGATTTVPGVTTTVPGATTTVPGATTTVPGATTTVPGATTTVPGATTTVPGATTTTVPGATTTVPGATTTVPGATTTLPANTTTTTANNRLTGTTATTQASTTTTTTAQVGSGASGGDSTGGGATGTQGGPLARTGTPLPRFIALAVALLMLGAVIVGLQSDSVADVRRRAGRH
jgi:hypothetical protein